MINDYCSLLIKGGSKRLWEVTKGGSEQLGHKLSKQARAIQNYKVVDKGWKSTVSWVKETKRQLQGIRVRGCIIIEAEWNTGMEW